MSKTALKFIADTLEDLGIDYEFGYWSTYPVPDPYFIGEYSEPESLTKEEDGYQEIDFILTGTSREWILLENVKEKIEKNISKTAILPNGNGIAVFYAGYLTIPTGDAELKRIQINLTVKEWSVI